MHRRALLFCTAAAVGLGVHAADGADAGEAGAAPTLTFTLAQMQALVDPHFPAEEGVAGVVALELQAPRLHLLPEINKLGAVQQARVRAPQSDRWFDARFDLRFALRYEDVDHALYATQLDITAMQLGGLKGQTVDILRQYVSGWLQLSLVEVALYRLSQADLRRMALFGMEPGPITVTDDGVRVALVVKRP